MTIDLLRWINVAAWATLIIYMLPASWSATYGRGARRGDPMRLACLATGAVMLGFNIRWLFFPNNLPLWQALYVLAAVDAIYIMHLAKAYGRGGRL